MKKISNSVKNIINIVFLSNYIFKGCAPLKGRSLRYLAELFEKSGTNKPTLPNRL